MSLQAEREAENRKAFYAGEAPKNHNQVARPLPTLEKLIQEVLDNMMDATNKASKPFRIAAGCLFAEARVHSYERFFTWAAKFKLHGKSIHRDTARTWIRLAKEEHQGEWPWPDKPLAPNPKAAKKRANRAAVGAKTDDGTAKAAKEARAAEKEKYRLALRKMCWRVIKAGYKVVATEVHPDTGGSDAEFKILGEVKDILEKKYKL